MTRSNEVWINQIVLDAPQIEETPWSLVSYALKADFMGVREILSYLKSHAKASADKLAPFRTHLWHRFALPWQALAVVLFAVPLGVAYSRRGAVGGIAGSIFVFFVFMFVNNLFLNLGKGGHQPGWLTVWMPHLLFGCLGLVLFYCRSNNRDLPKLRLLPQKRKTTPIARPRNRTGGNFDLKPPVAPLFMIAGGLFASGLVFCNVVILPLVIEWFVSFGLDRDITPELSVGSYIDFNVKFLLIFGCAFELPLVMTLAAMTGFASPRTFTRYRKHAILLCLIVSAVVTPDATLFTMLLMAVPLMALYEVGILGARLFGRNPTHHDVDLPLDPDLPIKTAGTRVR